MRKNTFIILITLLFTAVIAGTEFFSLIDDDDPFSVILHTQEGDEKINFWNKEGVYYLFLPSGSELSNITMKIDPMNSISFRDTPVKNGDICSIFPMNQEFIIKLKRFCKSELSIPIYITRSEKVPSLFIDTGSGGMDYIYKEKGNEESGEMRLYTADGRTHCNAEISAISGRGNSTWLQAPKKPFNVKLRTQEDLLDMGAARKWILLANYFDDSNICNQMIFDFSRNTGDRYAPECRFVDLYLNGDYAGLYLLAERNEVDPQRVAVSPENSFLLSMEMEWRWNGTNYPAFMSAQGVFLRIHHAGMPQDEIQTIWHSVEKALWAEDGIDPSSGCYWTELMDISSWAQQWLISEVFAEYDAGVMSQFLYYDGQTGKVYAGPAWDRDNVLNRAKYHFPNILVSNRRHILNLQEEGVFYHLWQKEEFREEVKYQYWNVFRPLLIELIESGMDSYLSQCCTSAKLDNLKWGRRDSSERVEEMRSYLQERMAFLEEYWESEEDYCIIELPLHQWRSYAVRYGDDASFLYDVFSGFGWGSDKIFFDKDTNERFDPSKPVTKKHTILISETEVAAE